MSLDAVLQGLLEVRGVTSACVVGADGVLVGGVEGRGGDLRRVAELVPSALGSSRVLGSLLGEGEIAQALVEFDREPVLLVPLPGQDTPGGGHVAVMTLASVADLGRLRFRLKGVLPRLVEALGAQAGTDGELPGAAAPSAEAPGARAGSGEAPVAGPGDEATDPEAAAE